ncbi:MAG: hypothetical protein ACXWQO_05315 [Bdellovibrionota bacterium]
MKSFLVLMALLVSGNALAAATITLQCDDTANLIFDGVRTITITGSKVTVVEETKRGAYVGHEGTLVGKSGGNLNVHFSFGVEMAIPVALVEGQLSSATVQLSTYDYPNETTECSVLK